LKRLKNIEPGDLYERMAKHSDNVKTECEKVLSVIKDVLINPNDANLFGEKEQQLRKFIDLINKVIEDARLSARSPFDLSLVKNFLIFFLFF
jgi:recombinational DNA repair ATPase RecF